MTWLAVVLLIVIGTVPSDASCGTEVCPIDLSQLDGHMAVSQPRPSARFTFEAIDQDQSRAGDRDVAFQQIRRLDHDEIETRNRNIGLHLRWPLQRAFDLSLTIPVVHRQHQHISADGHVHADGDDEHGHGGIDRWNFTRVGDVALRAGWQHSRGRSQLRLGVGLSLPTGATDVRNDAGTRAEPSLQPGSGALGLVLDAGWSHNGTTKGRQWDALASARYVRNGQGWRDYRRGREWRAHAGIGVEVASRVTARVQGAARWRAQDAPGTTGELVDATGGSWVIAGPGLSVEVVPGANLHGFWQIPVRKNVNGVQLTADSFLQLGLTWDLPLMR